MTIFAVLSLAACITSIILAGIVYAADDKKNPVNRVFLVVCGIEIVVSFAEFMVRQSTNPDSALAWIRIEIIWPMIMAALLSFAFIYTKSRLADHAITHAAVFGSGLAASMLFLYSIRHASASLEYWGYDVFKPSIDGLPLAIVSAYALLTGLTAFGLMFSYHIRMQDAILKIHSRNLSFAFLIPIIVALFTEAVPRMTGFKFPGLANTSFCIVALFIVYTIKRYRLFVLNPAFAADNIISTMNDLFILMDPSRKIVSVNKALTDLLGYSKNDLTGIPINMLFPVVKPEGPSEEIESRTARIKVYLAHDMRNSETYFVTRDAKTIPVAVSFSTLRGKKEEIAGYVCIAHDISDRIKYEEELREAMEKAEVANKAKSEFLSSMSHEIRTPMNAVIGFSGLLRDTKLDRLQQEYVDMICSSGDLLVALINDILDVSKIEARRLTLESIDLNLEDLIKGCMKIARQNLAGKNVELNLMYGDGVPKVFRGDPTRIRQVFLNLLNNAIKFTHQGNIDVVVRCGEEENQLSPHAAKTMKVSVKDTGIGIPPDKLREIFRPFVQADASTTRRYGGTGLGLSIAAALVELMDGTLTVNSEMGKGSEFTFSIELAEGQTVDKIDKNEMVREIPDGSVREETPSGRVRVLVAEDNEVNRKLMKILLTKIGCEADMVPNGLEVIDKMRNGSPYDLVLMDIEMPVMDGLESTRILRTKLNSTVPVVALTAYAMKEDTEKCLAAGMNDFLFKPVDAQRLEQKIAAWTAKR